MVSYLTYERYISIHALRKEGDKARSYAVMTYGISIHALRKEGDGDGPHSCRSCAISIHALRKEGDNTEATTKRQITVFLSTPSARRATTDEDAMRLLLDVFLSTPSARRATGRSLQELRSQLISIHALRKEGDSKNGEKHLRFCFIIKRSAQIWKSLSKNIRKNSCDLHRTA